MAGAVAKLLEMRSRNLIRDVSLGMNDPNAILSVIKHFPRGSIDSVMVAGAWNLLDQVRDPPYLSTRVCAIQHPPTPAPLHLSLSHTHSMGVGLFGGEQDAAELLLVCQERGIRVHNAGIFASGLLVGGNTYKYGPAPPHMVLKTKQWAELAEEYKTTVSA